MFLASLFPPPWLDDVQRVTAAAAKRRRGRRRKQKTVGLWQLHKRGQSKRSHHLQSDSSKSNSSYKMGNSRSSLLLQEENIVEISRETGCKLNSYSSSNSNDSSSSSNCRNSLKSDLDLLYRCCCRCRCRCGAGRDSNKGGALFFFAPKFYFEMHCSFQENSCNYVFFGWKSHLLIHSPFFHSLVFGGFPPPSHLICLVDGGRTLTQAREKVPMVLFCCC